MSRAGELRRLRRGWYALPQAPADVARAVELGGALSCESALAAHGARRLRSGSLHLRIPMGAAAPSARGVVVHRRPTGWRDAVAAVDEPRLALACALRCLDEEAFLVAADACLERGIARPDDLVDAARGAGRRLAIRAARADGRSQSATETLVRVRLRRLGIRVSPQVWVEGVGRVDLLVGDRLIIECDSIAHHTDESAYRSDRRRSRVALVGGYLTLRLTYGEVLFRWPEVEADILAIVRSGRHVAPRSTSSKR